MRATEPHLTSPPAGGWPSTRSHGQESYLVKSDRVALWITRTGACLGPVTFFPGEPNPIRPYAIAPWAEEPLPADTPPVIEHLRGDWFCSAFGANTESASGRPLPLHGETANGVWEGIARGETPPGCWIRMGIDLPVQGGRCEATTALLTAHSVIYQRHDLSGVTGPVNPGHHATLAFPQSERARLSFSALKHAATPPEPLESPERGGYSCLEPNTTIDDLSAVPCIDGTTTDLCRYPARGGYEDVAVLCTDPRVELGWSAVTCPEQGYVWFALRDARQLTGTLLWFSNGGRHYPPWNGRHVNVLGVEDMTGFFAVGLEASCRPNALSKRGIRTCLAPSADGGLSISYIQGVARTPRGFDQVAAIQPSQRGKSVVLYAHSGIHLEVPCEVDFIRTGRLSALECP